MADPQFAALLAVRTRLETNRAELYDTVRTLLEGVLETVDDGLADHPST